MLNNLGKALGFLHKQKHYILFVRICLFFQDFWLASEGSRSQPDMSKNMPIKVKTLQNLPQRPGVYLFKDAKGDIIYIGKAKNLKARVGSYFHKSAELGPKTKALVEHIADLESIEVTSEIEALILEAHLIQKHQPRYNIVLKDDKSFLYIEFRDSFVDVANEAAEKKSRNFPVLKASRKSDLNENSLSFGPFPNSSATRFVLRALRRYFPYRDCSKSKFNRYAKLKRPCLYGKIDLCPAPCVSQGGRKNYAKNLANIKSFLEGQSSSIVSEVELKMQEASARQDYEQAAIYRDIAGKFKYIRKKKIPATLFSQNPNLNDDLALQALEELQRDLPLLDELPKRIECYDISDLIGTDSVGSMVVAKDGKLVPSLYRRFKIKEVEGADDFAKMAEVLTRRLKKLKSDKVKEGWGAPDLIVLDGGKGQISAVMEVFEDLSLPKIPLVGLAKKEEKLYYLNESGKFIELDLTQDLEASGYDSQHKGHNLLVRLRDEAHRFAQAYHHKLRLKRLLE
ncbi:hypothetical protein GF360_02590 [candidate division WWE3 bacterium]|nr:hypothetical protein [candidate division WWE3 bacterium]